MGDTSVIDGEGRILARGDITNEVGGAFDTRGTPTPRPGKVEVTDGAYIVLADGTVAGPMERRNSKGDVYEWYGVRVYLAPDEEAEAVVLGTVWLDSRGNAHSDPSPLDGVALYPDPVFW